MPGKEAAHAAPQGGKGAKKPKGDGWQTVPEAQPKPPEKAKPPPKAPAARPPAQGDRQGKGYQGNGKGGDQGGKGAWGQSRPRTPPPATKVQAPEPPASSVSIKVFKPAQPAAPATGGGKAPLSMAERLALQETARKQQVQGVRPQRPIAAAPKDPAEAATGADSPSDPAADAHKSPPRKPVDMFPALPGGAPARPAAFLKGPWAAKVSPQPQGASHDDGARGEPLARGDSQGEEPHPASPQQQQPAHHGLPVGSKRQQRKQHQGRPQLTVQVGSQCSSPASHRSPQPVQSADAGSPPMGAAESPSTAPQPAEGSPRADEAAAAAAQAAAEQRAAEEEAAAQAAAEAAAQQQRDEEERAAAAAAEAAAAEEARRQREAEAAAEAARVRAEQERAAAEALRAQREREAEEARAREAAAAAAAAAAAERAEAERAAAAAAAAAQMEPIATPPSCPAAAGRQPSDAEGAGLSSVPAVLGTEHPQQDAPSPSSSPTWRMGPVSSGQADGPGGAAEDRVTYTGGVAMLMASAAAGAPTQQGLFRAAPQEAAGSYPAAEEGLTFTAAALNALQTADAHSPHFFSFSGIGAEVRPKSASPRAAPQREQPAPAPPSPQAPSPRHVPAGVAAPRPASPAGQRSPARSPHGPAPVLPGLMGLAQEGAPGFSAAAPGQPPPAVPAHLPPAPQQDPAPAPLLASHAHPQAQPVAPAGRDVAPAAPAAQRPVSTLGADEGRDRPGKDPDQAPFGCDMSSMWSQQQQQQQQQWSPQQQQPQQQQWGEPARRDQDARAAPQQQQQQHQRFGQGRLYAAPCGFDSSSAQASARSAPYQAPGGGFGLGGGKQQGVFDSRPQGAAAAGPAAGGAAGLQTTRWQQNSSEQMQMRQQYTDRTQGQAQVARQPAAHAQQETTQWSAHPLYQAQQAQQAQALQQQPARQQAARGTARQPEYPAVSAMDPHAPMHGGAFGAASGFQPNANGYLAMQQRTMGYVPPHYPPYYHPGQQAWGHAANYGYGFFGAAGYQQHPQQPGGLS